MKWLGCFVCFVSYLSRLCRVDDETTRRLWRYDEVDSVDKGEVQLIFTISICDCHLKLVFEEYIYCSEYSSKVLVWRHRLHFVRGYIYSLCQTKADVIILLTVGMNETDQLWCWNNVLIISLVDKWQNNQHFQNVEYLRSMFRVSALWVHCRRIDV